MFRARNLAILALGKVAEAAEAGDEATADRYEHYAEALAKFAEGVRSTSA